MQDQAPLYVDLDGTLVRGDLLAESAVALVKHRPLDACRMPAWLLRGKAHLKQQLAARVELAPGALPYNEELLVYLRAEKAKGRRLVLATAAAEGPARVVARHLGLFADVLATGGESNLVGGQKLSRIQAVNDGSAFWYAGNSAQDLPIWRQAEAAIVVEAPRQVLRRAQRDANVTEIFGRRGPSRLAMLPRALRMHQWVKNLLLFVPLVTAHAVLQPAPMLRALAGCLAFCLGASAIYLVNDVLDVHDDRQHPSKRRRPIAAGELGIGEALALAAALLIGAFTAAFLLAPAFGGLLTLYVALTTVYSFYLKRVALADVQLLAALYAIRVLAGGVAGGVGISDWLMAFSLFFFLSLAFVKRFAEVRSLRERQVEVVSGRGYRAQDFHLLSTMGICSGFLAALVFALYVHSEKVDRLYGRGDLLWGICPIILYWLARVWLLAHRGELDADPVVFALRDRLSYALGAAAALLMFLAL